MTTENTLHVAVDRLGRTWRVLEREDGSFSVYYSIGDRPGQYVVYDSLDNYDPPRWPMVRRNPRHTMTKKGTPRL